VHSLPHRRRSAVLGVTSVRGELLTAVALSSLLGLSADDHEHDPKRRIYPRVLVLRREATRVACPVDDVYGVERIGETALSDIPATLKAASTRYSKGLWSWNGSSVSVLDDQLLFYTLRRCIA
jgi:chemotaxis-related protein WspD